MKLILMLVPGLMLMLNVDFGSIFLHESEYISMVKYSLPHIYISSHDRVLTCLGATCEELTSKGWQSAGSNTLHYR